MNVSNTTKQEQNYKEKSTLFGIPKTKCFLIKGIYRNLSQRWFEELVNNQVEEDLQRFHDEEYEGMNRHISFHDREHRRVHDMKYLCELKTRLWADAIKNVYQQRFFQGMCCGMMMIGGMHIFFNLIKWWIGSGK
jgi:hypothetical protein